MTTHLTFLAAAEEQTRDLPAPAWVLGLCAFGILTLLLLIVLTFNHDR